MGIKRKAVVKSTEDAFGKAKVKVGKDKLDAEGESCEAEDEVEQTPALSEEELLAKREKEEKEQEQETVATRQKELKTMYVEELKKLAESKSLQIGKRDDMIKAIVKVEAKERADLRDHEAKIRAAVSKKKNELEAMSAPDLKGLCTENGIKGNLSKLARVEALLKLWLEDDGINKAFSQEAREEKESEFNAMEKQTLKKLCDKVGIEVFLKDVMVDRIVKAENEKGAFLKPSSNLEQDIADAAPKATSKKNLVDALLIKQKEENEKAQKKAEDAAQLAQKVKELSKKSGEELKKLLTKKNLNASGKKDDMVKALVDADLRDAAAAAQKKDLMAMSSEVMSKLLASRGLPISKSKNVAVASLLTHEAELQKTSKAYEAKMVSVVAKKRDELQNIAGSELKELCLRNGIAAGVAKEDRVNRLLEAIEKNGELDGVVSKILRDERKQSLETMDKSVLVLLCETLGIDPLVKEVMVERLLSFEAESGEPVSKKARKTNN